MVNMTVVVTGEIFVFSSPMGALQINSLEPYTTYMFTITSRTEVGYGPESTPFFVTTLEEGNY